MQEEVVVSGETLNKPEMQPAVKTYKVLEPVEYNGGQYPEGAHIQLTPEDAEKISGSLEEVTLEDSVAPTAEPPHVIEDSETLADNMRGEDVENQEAEELAEASTTDNAPTSDEA